MMERNEQSFRFLLLQYLTDRGLTKTAQALRDETPPKLEFPPGYDLQGPGLLYNLWIALDNFQALNICALRNTAPHINRGKSISTGQMARTSSESQFIVPPSNRASNMGASRLDNSTSSTQMAGRFGYSWFQVSPSPGIISIPPQDMGPEISSSQMVGTSGQRMYDRYLIKPHSSFESGKTLLSCDISSDGSIVASGGIGTGMKPFICYTQIGRAVNTLDSHASTISEVRFQPGTNIFATASNDKTVKLWDANNPEELLFTFIGHKVKVRSLDFHPLGKILCSCDHNVIKVLDVDRREVTHSFNTGGSIVRFQPESGSLLAIACRNVITILDSQNFTILHQLEENIRDIESMCWDVTGKLIACVSENELLVWLVSERLCIRRFPSNGVRFHSVIFHPRYPRVVIIGGIQYMLSLSLDNMIASKRWGSTQSITGLAASRGESKLYASVSDDSMVKIWI